MVGNRSRSLFSLFVSGETKKVRLLQSGADDYVVQTVGMAEMLGQRKRRFEPIFKSASEKTPSLGGRPARGGLVAPTVALNKGNQIRLTRKEYRTGSHPLRRMSGLVVTPRSLLKEILERQPREDNINICESRFANPGQGRSGKADQQPSAFSCRVGRFGYRHFRPEPLRPL